MSSKNTYFFLVFLLFYSLISCGQSNNANKNLKALKNAEITTKEILTGAQQTELYLPNLKQKNIAVVANHTSVLFKKENYTHLVDSLHQLNITIKKVFSPEHGFRGKADAAEAVADGVDKKTGIPIISKK